MLQANNLFQPRFNDKKGQRGKGKNVKGKDTLLDLRPCAGNAAAGPCASAVISAMRARHDADWYVAYDPNAAGRSMGLILVRNGSLMDCARSISADIAGKEYTMPGHALGFFAFNKDSVGKAMRSCCTIPVPGISDASYNDASRESLASALYIELLRARVFIPFQQLIH